MSSSSRAESCSYFKVYAPSTRFSAEDQPQPCLGGAEAGYRDSRDRNGFTHSVGRDSTQAILPPIFEDERHRLSEALPGLVLALALPVGVRDLKTIGDEPFRRLSR